MSLEPKGFFLSGSAKDCDRPDPIIVVPAQMFFGLFYLLIIFVMLLAGLFVIPLAWCLPLWQRVFLHPDSIKRYLRKARLIAITGGVILLLYVAAGYFDLHQWETNEFHSVFPILGAFLLAISTPTTIIGWLQLWLSNRYPKYCRGNGYGLLNLACPFIKSWKEPTYFLTFLQDGLLISFLLNRILTIYPVKEQPVSFGLCIIILLILFGYNWKEDYRRYYNKVEMSPHNQMPKISTNTRDKKSGGWQTKNGKYVDEPFT